ncbi:MAG: calcium-binding protein [Okeania sp. SIO2C2]|uniref:EF-hand domain-containing protein n=1 Tax=Okeania sp. SIO2C2 TaxID=2607787 RepID=UPI0013BD09E2|nr:EF-hand domain-containing protein [Okeania sp. SIO2C2]NEP87349.1 calcium-binding protein [Okeania sp. SIO2C2]
MLTTLQKRKWTRLFQVYDADQNGTVEKDDFEAIFQNLARARNLTQDMPQYQQLYAKFMEDWEYLQKDADQNGNGKIELAEWLQHFERRINSPNIYQILVEIANQIFELLDIDGNGVIGVEEYKTFYWSWRIPEDLAVEIFLKLDLNGDGSITKNEFLKLVREFHGSDDPYAPGNLFFAYY